MPEGGEKRTGAMRIFELVPPERIGVLIGPGGSTKERIEVSTGTIIAVDSSTGTVTIEPASESVASYSLLKTRDIIRAIALGFSPEQALRLLEDDQVLEVIDLGSIIEGENHLKRIKGRIIGEDGRTRKIIEETTGTNVIIGDKAVGIIGDFEQVKVASEAIRMLIEGKPHAVVYSFLEREARRMKRKKMTDLWKS
jgi:ribosomal RNA assembly protein